MILARIDPSILSAIVSFVLGGGLIGGYATFRKLKPESDRLVVDSAEIVLKMTSTALEQAVARHAVEVAEMRGEIKELKANQERQEREAKLALAECEAERREMRRSEATLKAERDAERASNWELRSRIEVLEAEVAALRSAGGKT